MLFLSNCCAPYVWILGIQIEGDEMFPTLPRGHRATSIPCVEYSKGLLFPSLLHTVGLN